jgi:hypothetical protein
LEEESNARATSRLPKVQENHLLHQATFDPQLSSCYSFIHAMPICIECRYPVKTLYTEYSGADDKSSGHGVRLTVCKNCGRFCDKYVEHDYVVLFIDLVLIKPQVNFPLFSFIRIWQLIIAGLPAFAAQYVDEGARSIRCMDILSSAVRILIWKQPSIIRLGILLLLFDVYLTWARIENQTFSYPTSPETNNGNFLLLAQQNIVFQYVFFRIFSFPAYGVHMLI